MGAILIVIGIVLTGTGVITTDEMNNWYFFIFLGSIGILSCISGGIILVKDEFYGAYNKVKKEKSDIEVAKRKYNELEEKLEKIVNKFIDTEKDVMTRVARGDDLLALAENFPELGANITVQELIKKLETLRGNIAYAEEQFNWAVEKYNDFCSKPSTRSFRPGDLPDEINYVDENGNIPEIAKK